MTYSLYSIIVTTVVLEKIAGIKHCYLLYFWSFVKNAIFNYAIFN